MGDVKEVKKNPKRQIVLIVIIFIIFVVGAFFYGYLNKGGKNLISDMNNQIVGEQQENIQKKSDKIYQDKKVVGEVTGEVKREGGDLIFEELSETTHLKRNVPIEYQGVHYKIIRMENYIKEYMNMKSEKKYDILKGVTCRELK